MATCETETYELQGGMCDGKRGEIGLTTNCIVVPVMMRSEEFRARISADFDKWVEEWDGPRDSWGFPRPPIGQLRYHRTLQRTADGAVVFR